MDLSVTLEAMVEAGCTAEQMLAVARAHDRVAEKRLAEKRAKDAERQRKSRMSREVTVTPCDSRDTEKEPIVELSLVDNSTHSPTKEKPPKGGKKKGKVPSRMPLSEEAQPTEWDRGVGAKSGMTDATIESQWLRFKAHHLGKGSLMANWGQAWVTWVTNWKEFGAKQAQPAEASKPSVSGGRRDGRWVPGRGMVYPDGSSYSMLYNHHEEHDDEARH